MNKFTDVKQLIAWIESQRRFTPKVSLKKMRNILAFFNNPHHDLRYIHVGGTNGKGSTVTFIKSILSECGYRVATFTSPYVRCFNERIGYMNQNISDNDLLEIGNDICIKYEELEKVIGDTPSFFELTTLIAFIYFKKVQPDFVVLEVGMGGALDATNVVEPIITIITNVNYDHMHVLGNTIEEIAKTKLGIVKENVPLITIYNQELHLLFEERCKNNSAPLFFVNKEYHDVSFGEDVMRFTYHDYNLETSLLGFHQCENISLALKTIEVMTNLNYIVCKKENITSGIKKATWPARMQIISKNPFIIVDGAHNIDGISRLCEALPFITKGQDVEVVFAVSKDKEYHKMIGKLKQIAKKITLTKFTYKRSATGQMLQNELQYDDANIIYNDDLTSIIENIITSCSTNTIYVFCGSLYFASEVLKIFKK